MEFFNMDFLILTAAILCVAFWVVFFICLGRLVKLILKELQIYKNLPPPE